MEKFPLNFSTRLRQFLCSHETIGIAAFSGGINGKEDYYCVVYECGKCRHCISKWEKKEDFDKGFSDELRRYR